MSLSVLEFAGLEFVDIGVNLTHSSFKSCLDDVVYRSQAQGVNTLILTGLDITISEQAIALSAQDGMYCTAGVHPHEASQWSNSTYTELKNLSQHPKVVAIGETGLDFYRNFSEQQQQIKAFEGQLELSCETQLPLFMHERDASDQQSDILFAHRDQLSKGVIHCFTGDKKTLYRYLDLNLYIGITGWICDERRGKNVLALVKDIPADRLMIETDSPFLLPRNLPEATSQLLKNKKTNEPCTLPWIAQTIAQATGKTLETIAEETTSNAKHFFNLP